jgi:hypothetical protein
MLFCKLYRYYTREQGMADTGRGGNVPVFFVDSKRGKDVHMVCVTVIHVQYSIYFVVSSASKSCTVAVCAAMQ